MVADRTLTEVVTSFSAAVVEEFAAEDVLRQLASGAVRALGVDGAGIMVPDDQDLLRFAFASGSSGEAVTRLERLQEQLQAGPCRDSWRREQVVEVADLATEQRWPSFAQQAVSAGLRAVTTLPLLARGRLWGVLDLYRAEPGHLGDQERAAAQVLAQVATSYLVVIADRDAARQAQSELAHRAMHDPLTGLPVRWVFLEQLANALARLRRHHGHVGVLFADVDGLKYVNDTYGHDAGDRLLVTCAERIRAAVRPSDVVARVGGDEFLVLLEDLSGAESAAAVAHRILSQLGAPYRSGDQVLRPSASLGLALTTDPATSPAALITHADSAMYRAKRAGRGRYEVFDALCYAADRARATVHTGTAEAVRTALRAGQLTVHYQPVVDLTGTPAQASRRHLDATPSGLGARAHPSGSVYAVEALVRWQHPDRGLLLAAEFVPQAERAGLLPELGAWVLATACEQLAAWDSALGAAAPPRLFVKVSVDQLTGAQFVPHLTAVLQRTGVAATRLTLEITETGLLTDSPAAGLAFAAVQELGCSVAVDDFGTGYSSLSRLVELPASTWKLDRSFARDLDSRPPAAAVVHAVVQLGRRLDRTVIAEGVEDDATLRALRTLGCTFAQGFHLGPAQPAAQISALLAPAKREAAV